MPGSPRPDLPRRTATSQYPFGLRVNDAREVDVPVNLYGPGDVTGLDPREVIRTDPHHLLTSFEPVLFSAG
jgi:hypothetical protein